VKVFLVRHASAGKRSKWQGDDRLRPLDDRGLLQAQKLVEQLRDASFERILSSPYVRCVQTVEPLAETRGLPVAAEEALAEGGGLEAALRLFRAARPGGVVACVHGDLFEELLGEKRRKGSTTVLELDAERDPVVLEQLEPAA
jgi:phosphohistidine phosphatase SixA